MVKSGCRPSLHPYFTQKQASNKQQQHRAAKLYTIISNKQSQPFDPFKETIYSYITILISYFFKTYLLHQLFMEVKVTQNK
ncbi:hypothetical protein Hanom_Chr09g00792761 [Helianthus anomalus]